MAQELWPYQLFSHNSYFGNSELALQGGHKQFRKTSARCESDRGQVLRLPREHYNRLCQEFPQPLCMPSPFKKPRCLLIALFTILL